MESPLTLPRILHRAKPARTSPRIWVTRTTFLQGTKIEACARQLPKLSPAKMPRSWNQSHPAARWSTQKVYHLRTKATVLDRAHRLLHSEMPTGPISTRRSRVASTTTSHKEKKNPKASGRFWATFITGTARRRFPKTVICRLWRSTSISTSANCWRTKRSSRKGDQSRSISTFTGLVWLNQVDQGVD